MIAKDVSILTTEGLPPFTEYYGQWEKPLLKLLPVLHIAHRGVMVLKWFFKSFWGSTKSHHLLKKHSVV